MKNFILYVVIIVALCTMFSGCFSGCGSKSGSTKDVEGDYTNTYPRYTELLSENMSDESPVIVKIAEGDGASVYVDVETRVEYLYKNGFHALGFTPRCNADGTLRLYKGDLDALVEAYKNNR